MRLAVKSVEELLQVFGGVKGESSLEIKNAFTHALSGSTNKSKSKKGSVAS
jgi:hypothetical protein